MSASAEDLLIMRNSLPPHYRLHTPVPYRQATDLMQKCFGHAQRLVFLQAPGLYFLGCHAGEVAVDCQEDPVQVKGLHDSVTLLQLLREHQTSTV